jgi:hypothetical protein
MKFQFGQQSAKIIAIRQISDFLLGEELRKTHDRNEHRLNARSGFPSRPRSMEVMCDESYTAALVNSLGGPLRTR